MLKLALGITMIQTKGMSKNEAPITAWFIPRVTPYGGAPEEIKEGWVDVPLPLRYDRPAEGPDPMIGHDVNNILGVTILANSASVISTDAVKALRIFGRDEAADWWDGYFRGAPADLAFAVEPGDQILPDSFIRLVMPGIETFDEMQS